jgi:hypothetical protein
LTLAATLPGSLGFHYRNRWYRFAQPPANFCDTSGV